MRQSGKGAAGIIVGIISMKWFEVEISLVLGLEFLFWVRRFGVSFPSPSFLRYDLDILVKLLIII